MNYVVFRMNTKILTRAVIGGGILILVLLLIVLLVPKPESELPPKEWLVVSESGNMKVYSPAPHQQVTRPLIIVGEGRTFENAFSFRLVDAFTDRVLAEGHDMLNAPDTGQFGPFSVVLDYPATAAGRDEAFLEVFEYSAKDGSIVNNVRFPVGLVIDESTAVKIFFNNTHADPNLGDCSRVFPVARVVPKTTAVGRAALDQLLAGAAGFEKNVGYSSSIPEGVKINSLTIQSGTARVDFSKELNQVGGSCRVQAIRAQIEQTLKQFPTVSSVVISVNGNVDEALQP